MGSQSGGSIAAREWVINQEGKHFCICGCGGTIPIRWMQYYIGVPKTLRGHAQKVTSPIAAWVKAEQGKHVCDCGCGKFITIKRHHKYAGIPLKIRGHSMPKEELQKRAKESNKRWYEKTRNSRGIKERPPIMTDEQRKQKIKDNYKKNIERNRARGRAYAIANRKRAIERTNEWVKKNRERSRITKHLYKSRLKKSEGSYTVEEWNSLKERYGFMCLRCGRSEPEVKLLADHVIPVSKGGASYISNIQPLCNSCNSSKKADPTDYRKQEVANAIQQRSDSANS